MRIVGSAAIFAASGAPLPKALGPRPGGRPGPLERMDRLCAIAVCAADGALHAAGSLGLGLDGERVGIVLGTAAGCHQADEDFYRALLAAEEGPAGASPRLFVYTLPSSPAGEIAIRHGLRGPAFAEVGGRTAGLLALGAAQDMLAQGRAQAVLVCAADVVPSARDGAVALLLVAEPAPEAAQAAPEAAQAAPEAAQAAPEAAQAAPGAMSCWIGPVCSAFCAGRPAQALRDVLAQVLPGGAPTEALEVLGDPLVAGALGAQLSVHLDNARYPHDVGAVGPLHAVGCAGAGLRLILSADTHGHAAGLLCRADADPPAAC